MKIETFTKFYPTNGKGFKLHYFRARADNGEIIFQSESYRSKAARDKTVKLVRRTDWAMVDWNEIGEAEL